MVSVERVLRIAHVGVYAVLWCVTILITVKLTKDWLDSGRAEKVSVDSLPISQLDPPWIILLNDMGTCTLELAGCEFWPQGKGKNITSVPGVLTGVSGTRLNNQRAIISQKKARELGVTMRTKLDTLWVGLRVTNDSLEHCLDGDEMQQHSGLHLYMIPAGGEDVQERLENDEADKIPRDRIGTIISVGLGSLVSLSFSLKQEVYVNGTTRSWTQFFVTQHPIVRPGDAASSREVQFEITPSDFLIQRTVHKQGTQVWELLGSIFGWAGVFSGMCMLTVWGWIADLVRRVFGDERPRGMGPPRDSVEMDSSKAHGLLAEGDGCSGCQALSAELADLRRQLGDRVARLEAAATGATSSSASPTATGLGPAPASRTPKGQQQKGATFPRARGPSGAAAGERKAEAPRVARTRSGSSGPEVNKGSV